MKIPTLAWNSTDIFWSDPLKAIFAIDSNNIWVTTGGQVINYDGNKWSKHKYLFLNYDDTTFGEISTLWGRSVNELWAAGVRENIWFFNGYQWKKLHYGDLSIYNIKGDENSNEMYVVALKYEESIEKRIYKLSNNTMTPVSTDGIPYSIRDIWFISNKKYYVVGSGIFVKSDINNNQPWEAIWQGITTSYTNSIDGNDINDIVICGSYGELLHFNGISWKSFKEEIKIPAGVYKKVKIRDNIVVTVGHDSPKALITLGQR